MYLSPWVLIYSTVHSTDPYLIPNVQVDACSVLTNSIMTSAFRGFGDGSAVVRTGIPDLGGGQRESVRTVVAEVLGLKLEEVHVISTDSQVTPPAGTVTATRALYMSGNAAKLAAENVRQVIVEKAAEMLGVRQEVLELRDKTVYSREEPGKKAPLADVIKQCLFQGKIPQSLTTFKAPFTEPISSDVIKDPVFPDFTFGAQAAEVEVDTETGEVKVLKWATAYDVGKAINLNRVEGQMERGAAQGLGFGLMEDYLEQDGLPLTWNLHDYLIPTSKDVPDIKCIVLESESGKGPFGAKGIGEPSISAAGPAVAGAISDAIGVRITNLPATPERVFFAMQKKGG